MNELTKMMQQMENNSKTLENRLNEYRGLTSQAARAQGALKRCYRDYTNAISDLEEIHSEIVNDYEAWQASPTAAEIQAIFNTFEPTPTPQH